jgi:predicted nucleic acid-binding Zn ribbon protein
VPAAARNFWGARAHGVIVTACACASGSAACGDRLMADKRPIPTPVLSGVPYLLCRRVSHAMPVLIITVRIMSHAINPGDKYGRLTVIREVPKVAANGKRYRAALCRCDCGEETAPRLTSLHSGDAQSCGCSRGQPKYQQKRCPVCGTLTMIRRDRRSCSRACGYQLVRAARQSQNPSYAVWHGRVRKARGPASGYTCVDCGNPAQDWSTVNPSSDDVWSRFQPLCRRCHRRHDGAVGDGNPRAKLTSAKVRELRARRADGLTYRQLAAEFGISDVSACAAVHRKTWTHVS